MPVRHISLVASLLLPATVVYGQVVLSPGGVGVRAPVGPIEDRAVKRAGEFLAAAKETAGRLQAFPIPAPADDWWLVEYQVEGGLAVSPGPAVYVHKKTGEVTRQPPKGMPPRM
jgi:hypothetical protein